MELKAWTTDNSEFEDVMVAKKKATNKHYHNNCTMRQILFATVVLLAVISVTLLVCFFAFRYVVGPVFSAFSHPLFSLDIMGSDHHFMGVRWENE